MEKTEEAYPKNNDGKTPLNIAAEGGYLQAYRSVVSQIAATKAGKNLYMCLICADQFASIGDLTKHISEVHEERKWKGNDLYLCTVCQDRFANIKKLTKHVSGVHGIHHELIPRLKKPRLD